jgi:two-component system, NarL family, response regulator DevR
VEIEVLIVDDHGLIREGLRALFDAEEGLLVVGEARRADEALALAAKLRPGVIVLDIGLPDRGGLEIVGEIREASPASRVLVCSGLAEGSMLVAAAAAGADGFVAKESPNSEIVDAVRRVADGAAVVGPESAALMFRDLRDRGSNASRLEALSEREREVLGHLAEGLTNREISHRMFIAEKTVRNHVSSVLRKLSLRHRTEAALFAVPLKEHLHRPR